MLISYKKRLAQFFELGGPDGRIRSMEGLRGLAVTLVFFVHYEALFAAWVPQGSASAPVARFLSTVGHAGVDLFFELSGFLIYGAILKGRMGYASFMRRRVQRIYPTFFALLCTYLLLSMMLPSEAKWPLDQGARAVYVIENLLLMPGMFDIVPMMTVAWTLSYEVFYYALIPIIVGGFGMRSWRPQARVLTFLGLAAAFTFACFLGAGRVQLILFVSGILVYEAYHSTSRSRNRMCAISSIASDGSSAARTMPASRSWPSRRSMASRRRCATSKAGWWSAPRAATASPAKT